MPWVTSSASSCVHWNRARSRNAWPNSKLRSALCRTDNRSTPERRDRAMTTRTQLRRVERAEQAAKTHLRFSPDCLCLPDDEQPEFRWQVEAEIAASVLCPLHGLRFKVVYALPISCRTFLSLRYGGRLSTSLRAIPKSRKGQLRSELMAGERGRCSRRRCASRVRPGLTRRNEIAVRETSGGLEVRVEPPRGIVLARSLRRWSGDRNRRVHVPLRGPWVATRARRKAGADQVAPGADALHGCVLVLRDGTRLPSGKPAAGWRSESSRQGGLCSREA